jgi:hypothetical protein
VQYRFKKFIKDDKMRNIFSGLCLLFTLCISTLGFAGTGNFFNIVATGNTGNVNISLCLNGTGALSCQNYTFNKLSLAITTTIPNHTYPAAGIKINTPGYTIANIGLNCTPIKNGYCLFAANQVSAKNLTLIKGNASLSLSPANLANGSVNTNYSQTLIASGGTNPYTYVVTSGLLPLGLSLAPATGVLSGSPTTANTYTFTVTATDNGKPQNNVAKSYTVVITGPLAISPAMLANGLIGSNYSQTISASGGTGPYSYAVTSGSLPLGLSLAPATGIISGSPNTADTYTFTVTATDAGSPQNSGSKPYTVVISGPLVLSPATLPNGLIGSNYNQTISASGGTAPYNFTVTSGNLPSGLLLDSLSGTISGTPDTANSYTFTVQATDAGIPQNSGTQSYTVVINSAAVVLTLTPTSLPSGTTSQFYSQTITANGGSGNYSYAVTNGSLPPGFTLDPSTGVISGTCNFQTGNSFTVTATDNNNTASTGSLDYSIFIISASVPLTINPPTLPNCAFFTSYSQQIVASGGNGPYSYGISSGSLPNGLTLDPFSGIISGICSAPGNFMFVVNASDSSGPPNNGSQSYTVNVS